MTKVAGWSHAETACRSRMYTLDYTGIAWVRTSVEQAAEPGVAVVGSWDTVAWRWLTEAHRTVLDSDAIAGRPSTAAVVDDPWPSSAPWWQDMVYDGYRRRIQRDRG